MDDSQRDWRIGLSVKPKYRTHERYYEPPALVVDTRPNGTNGIADQNGILCIKTMEGTVLLVPSEEWITA